MSVDARKALWRWLRPIAWMVWVFPIMAVVDLTSGGIRAILLGVLLSITVATARRLA